MFAVEFCTFLSALRPRIDVDHKICLFLCSVSSESNPFHVFGENGHSYVDEKTCELLCCVVKMNLPPSRAKAVGLKGFSALS